MSVTTSPVESTVRRPRLHGRVAFVTGGTRGIGAAIGHSLAEQGADVAAGYSRDRETADAFVGKLAHEGLNGTAHQGNIGSAEDCRRTVSEVIGQHGRLDILVNNAGIIRRAPAIEFAEEDWESVIKINLSAAFYLSQASAKHFVAEERGGKIINTASVLSYEGGVIVPSYSASKAGIANLTRALANEWAPLGINVNAIAPSYFTTELTSALREDAERSEALLARLPAGRFGEPEDLKGAVVFLASDAADYVHGTVLPVDGGWLAR
jgi:2-deoxy-D-gluconate 3-dehydrogenase